MGLLPEHLLHGQIQKLHQDAADQRRAQHDRDLGDQAAGFHMHEDEEADHEAAAGNDGGDEGGQQGIGIQLSELKRHPDHEEHRYGAQQLGNEIQPRGSGQELADRAGQQTDNCALQQLRPHQQNGQAVMEKRKEDL